ncbi:MAG: inorganic phosphate transporter [Rhodospirillaceae bacterium]|jgi:PiT family inorganic phosphate transporter|nr:inorganic phosphate transporter [Rhodospirillaceae bacterium]MBT6403387.1 inorganic phosphate transporter [Rhodospirillaceae bacterium]MBT6537816.1 inorganic phosphate transporter [Rhodospirillaceae bacterium]MBT7362142.1 inorganic phosphate transporter [Rhodospirillaceae bacterium]
MSQVKRTLDKDLEKIVHVEAAAQSVAGNLRSHGIAVIFLGLSALLAAALVGVSSDTAMVVVAAILGGYMALNIGANDVANNVGPAVGSRALTLFGALVIAAIFESAGALLAGGDVVSTISKGIIDPSLVEDASVFVLAMMSALVAAALWVNLATFVGAPVSTTHAVVGGVMGAGIAAVGFQLVNWGTMGAIAASWVISPLMGGVIAAGFLAFIKINLIYRDDKIAAARRWVPMLVAIMAGAFAWYLAVKGFKRIWRPEIQTVIIIALVTFFAVWAIMRPLIRRQSEGMENRNQSLRILFRIPLICSAALLSFAHGANDVANAIGPLAAILSTVQSGDIAAKVEVPIWIMTIGAFGISLGLFLYGPKLIRMVGDQITKMNPMRAYCVALSAAITVIIASWLGLPVSSTHIAVGAVFGVGFFREYYTGRSKRRREMVSRSGKSSPEDPPVAPEVLRSRKLVRRSHFLTIIAAWVITVPATAIMSALVFFGLSLVV